MMLGVVLTQALPCLFCLHEAPQHQSPLWDFSFVLFFLLHLATWVQPVVCSCTCKFSRSTCKFLHDLLTKTLLNLGPFLIKYGSTLMSSYIICTKIFSNNITVWHLGDMNVKVDLSTQHNPFLSREFSKPIQTMR